MRKIMLTIDLIASKRLRTDDCKSDTNATQSMSFVYKA